MLDKLPETYTNNQMLPPPIPPRGRWAQRIDGQGLVVRSYLDSDSVIPFPNNNTSEIFICFIYSCYCVWGYCSLEIFVTCVFIIKIKSVFFLFRYCINPMMDFN